MSQHLALAHARLLRCCRRVHSAVMQAVAALQPYLQPEGYADTTDELRRQFELEEMKAAVLGMTPVLMLGLFWNVSFVVLLQSFNLGQLMSPTVVASHLLFSRAQ